jgi:hypothetical protein
MINDMVEVCKGKNINWHMLFKTGDAAFTLSLFIFLII